MFLDGATTRVNKDRFIQRVIESEVIFYLSGEDGVANSVSNENESIVILMFWSDAAYARRVLKHGFDDCEVQEINLFDFLYRWLPGMSGDGVLAGVNWTSDLIGPESDPYELRIELEELMPLKMQKEYESHYQELKKED